MVGGKSRLLVLVLALGACSDELRGPPASDLVIAAERALSTFGASPETQSLLDRAETAAWSLDARALHEAIPAKDAVDATRAVWFDFRGAAEKRSVGHRPVGGASVLAGVFEPSAEVPHEGPPELGRYSLLLASRPLGSGDYRLRVTSAIDSGRGDLMTIWRAVPGALRSLERGAPAAEARRSFPRTAAFAQRYGEITAAITPAKPRGASVELRLRARRAAVASEYPHLVRYAERMARRVRTSATLEGEDGAELAAWRFRSPEEGVRFVFATHEGRLQTKDGSLVDLTVPHRLRLVQSSSAEVLGVTSTIAGLASSVDSEPGGEAASIAFEARGDPAIVKVEGALFGIVPIAAIDAVLPGTLEGSLRSLLGTLLHGRDGRGVAVVVRSRPEPGNAHEISSTLVADVPATRFARRALGLAAALVEADASERADMLRFARDLAACLAADLGNG